MRIIKKTNIDFMAKSNFAKIFSILIITLGVISLVINNDLDYLDMLYREKFRYGTKDEIIIKLK